MGSDRRIASVDVIGLSLGRVDGTWLEDLGFQEDINTLVEVATDDGVLLAVPTSPGLGIELDRVALKRFAT